MSSISRDVVRKLIEKYENYPELYNVQHALYKNKTKRQACLNIITKEVNELCGTSLTVDEVKKKINGLRTQFFNEVSKERKSETSGKGSDEIYKSNWWCFELLCFLKNSAPARHGESNLKIANTDACSAEDGIIEHDMEIIYDGPVDSLPTVQLEMSPPPSDDTSRPSTSQSEGYPAAQAESTRNKRKKCAFQNQSVDLLSKATYALEQVCGSSQEDHFDAFGKLIATELRRIKNPATVNRIKRDVMNLIFDTLDDDMQD